ncbi:hypothetical protein GCM10009834_04360 [Streptomonospora arabica]|uniref:Uncharacterized protein n=1 Tax=Streptomonospora halophila TaxID=427369 RepID=A0ABP9G1E4_9ACTN
MLSAALRPPASASAHGAPPALPNGAAAPHPSRADGGGRAPPHLRVRTDRREGAARPRNLGLPCGFPAEWEERGAVKITAFPTEHPGRAAIGGTHSRPVAGR